MLRQTVYKTMNVTFIESINTVRISKLFKRYNDTSFYSSVIRGVRIRAALIPPVTLLTNFKKLTRNTLCILC